MPLPEGDLKKTWISSVKEDMCENEVNEEMTK